MTARIIDGKATAAELRIKVASEVKRLVTQHGVTPGLAVVLAGHDPASEAYVGSKAKATVETGMKSFDHRLPDSVGQDELLALVKRLNADPAVHGILVQLPLPQADRRAAGAQRDRSGRRTSTAFIRSTPGGSPRALPALVALHAARLHHAGEDRACVARRPGRGGDRPLQHRRQAGDATAARRERHRHGRALEDPRSAGGLPPGRPAGGRRSDGRKWCAATGSSPARP